MRPSTDISMGRIVTTLTIINWIDQANIEQDKQQVEVRRRQADNTWKTVIYQSSDRVMLQSIDLAIAIAQLYQGLD